MFPRGTVGSGLPVTTVSRGTTRIRFPAPGEGLPRRSRSAPPPEIPHIRTFGFAYVNELGRGTMATREYAKFPTGAILVREKLLTPEAPNPEVLVVMIKREAGFNRKVNDWEFMTVSGDLRRVEAREKQGKCQKCHKSEAWNDYVWRYPAPGVR